MKKRVLIILIALALSNPITVKADDIEYSYIEDVALSYNISPELVEAIIYYESGYNERIVSSTGCVGYMQISPSVHSARARRLGVTDLKDGKQNILVGCDLLAELFATYEDVNMVLDAYHGALKSEKWYETHTSDYADRILKMSARLEEEHKKLGGHG